MILSNRMCANKPPKLFEGETLASIHCRPGAGSREKLHHAGPLHKYFLE